jgi:hypothetical protein
MAREQHARVHIVQIGHGLHRPERGPRRSQQANLEGLALGDHRRHVFGPAAFQQPLRFPVQRLGIKISNMFG